MPGAGLIVYLNYMGRILSAALALLWLDVLVSPAQTQAPARFVGTVTEIKVESAEIVVRPDTGPAVTAKLTSDTAVERIAPGAKDLKSAQPMKASDIAVGDRVLVVLMPDAAVLRRIVVMPATDITKRNETDRADWTKRGVSGVVTAKTGNDISLKMRTLQGETHATVTVTDKTAYKRYAPDSVKFADAKGSNLADISVGDQLRTRGQKSEDGLKVTAEEIIFGTFQTKAGAVTAVNPETREITLKELNTNKTLVVKLTADSQLKKMPDFSAMAGAMHGGAAPASPGGPQGAVMVRPAPGGDSAPPQGGRAGGMMLGGRAGAGFDIAQMIDRMPPAKLEDVKPGETIIVSSTKGSKSDEITAITMLSNADGLIRMITMAAAASAGRGAAGGLGGAGPSLGGLATGLDSLNIPGITP